MKIPTVGIIGGSGLYEIEGLKHIQEKKITTPFGAPSDVYICGELEGLSLIFLPRHGRGHKTSPSEINYRANIYGMKSLGAQALLTMSAVGSLKEEIPPGDIVIVDQFIDRTKARESTFFENGCVAHVSFGDPTCPALSEAALKSAQAVSDKVHKGGTYLCMEGPQFSTRAESNMYRSWGASVIGMTNIPESKLAREASLCYASIAFSTDYDCWREEEEQVNALRVLEVVKSNVQKGKKIIKKLPSIMSMVKTTCTCAKTLENAVVTEWSNVPKATQEKLSLLLGGKK